MHNPQFVDGPHGTRLAYATVDGAGPQIVFLGGFRSDMTGTKAAYLDAWARASGHAFLRFDYSGHGASGDSFANGTVSRWTDDALAVLDARGRPPFVLVGSSMGAWIMTRVALAHPEKVAGMVGIAAAPDFTEDLLWPRLDPAQRAMVQNNGVVEVPSLYSEVPDVYTRALFEDGRAARVLTRAIPLDMPLRLLHGDQDELVPWQHAAKLMAAFQGRDATLTLVKGGDHPLSEEADLRRLTETIESLIHQIGSAPA